MLQVRENYIFVSKLSKLVPFLFQFAGDDPTINWSQMIVEPSRELQEAGVEIFAVGVTGNASPEELRVMASDPDTQHVFQVQTFDQLFTLVDPISTRICHGTVV